MKIVTRSLTATLLLALAGCSANFAPVPPPPPVAIPTPPVVVTSGPITVQPEAPPAEQNIQLDVASWDETLEIIASHKGKVVVLDLWSNYCEPCLQEFPQLVALSQRHPDDVVCLAFNCNFTGSGKPEDERQTVLDFLTKQKAPFRNLISSDGDEVVYKKAGIASIPVVQVYGRNGELSKQFDNEKEEYGKSGFNYEQHIAPYVETLVIDK